MPRESTDFVRSLNKMYDALDEYACAHKRRYGSPIGEDGVLGDAWIAAVRALAELLNGETGSIDCGTFDRHLRDLASAHGFTRDFEDADTAIAPSMGTA